MIAPDERRLGELLELVHQPYGPVPDIGLPAPLLTGLADLIPAQHVSCFELDVRGGSAASAATPVPDLSDPDRYVTGFRAHFASCAFCNHAYLTGDYVWAHRLTEFYPRRGQHADPRAATAADRDAVDYFGRHARHPSLLVPIAGPPGQVRRLVLCRPRTPFTERETVLLSLLRPHLDRAWARADRARGTGTELTGRQLELLRLAAAGSSTAEIADEMTISAGTVRKHFDNIFARLGVRSRAAAVARALPELTAS